LERQIKEAEREYNLCKKDTATRILNSQVCVNYRKLRRETQSDISKVKKQISSLEVLCKSKPKSRSDLLKHYRGIIFYGPPGTGKVRLLKASST